MPSKMLSLEAAAINGRRHGTLHSHMSCNADWHLGRLCRCRKAARYVSLKRMNTLIIDTVHVTEVHKTKRRI